MVVRWKIKELMAKKELTTGKRVSYRSIAADTGISPNTLSTLATGKAQMVGVSTIDRLLEFFDCEPNDLIARIKEKE